MTGLANHLTLVLRAGDVVFHGDSGPPYVSLELGALWVARNRLVAEGFATEGRVYEFRVKNDCVLVEVPVASDPALPACIRGHQQPSHATSWSGAFRAYMSAKHGRSTRAIRARPWSAITVASWSSCVVTRFRVSVGASFDTDRLSEPTAPPPEGGGFICRLKAAKDPDPPRCSPCSSSVTRKSASSTPGKSCFAAYSGRWLWGTDQWHGFGREPVQRRCPRKVTTDAERPRVRRP